MFGQNIFVNSSNASKTIYLRKKLNLHFGKANKNIFKIILKLKEPICIFKFTGEFPFSTEVEFDDTT